MKLAAPKQAGWSNVMEVGVVRNWGLGTADPAARVADLLRSDAAADCGSASAPSEAEDHGYPQPPCPGSGGGWVGFFRKNTGD